MTSDVGTFVGVVLEVASRGQLTRLIESKSKYATMLTESGCVLAPPILSFIKY